MTAIPPDVDRVTFLNRVEGHVQLADGSFRRYAPAEAERGAILRAEGRLGPATHRMVDGNPVPIALTAAAAPVWSPPLPSAPPPAPEAWRVGKTAADIVAEHERLRHLAETADDRAAQATLRRHGVRTHIPAASAKPADWESEIIAEARRLHIERYG